MSNLAPAASARPDIISLDVLLNDVDEGRVHIPQFQRPYVWTPQMMRDLFESVLNGYPIGSLLFWTPRESDVRTMTHIGPLPAPQKNPQTPISLVLDGHQRLATLYGVLRLPEEFPKDETAGADKLGWWLGYDLEMEEPRQLRRPADFDNPSILPLRTVLKTADFVRFARAVDASPALSATQKSTYIDRADRVQRAIRDYRIALTTMKDGTVDDAVAIFSRINRSGRRITTDQMAVALTYHQGFNLEYALDAILAELDRYGFGDVSRTVVLQSLLRGAGRNFAKPKFEELRQTDGQIALESATKPVTESLLSAAQFLNQSIGFSTGRLLPYAMQLLLLGVFFFERKISNDAIDEKSREVLVRWFWATSFSGWFSSANSAEVQDAVEAMERFAKAKDIGGKSAFEEFFLDRPLRPFPKTFDRRSARIRSMLLIQIAKGPLLDPISGAEINGSSLLADEDRRDLPYVFAPDGTRAARSPANRMLLDRKHGGAVRSALVTSIDSAVALESHAINQEARSALQQRDLETFVKAREKALRVQEEEFLQRFDLVIGEFVEQSDEEADVDED
ncbi:MULTISPECIES: DUF262 domain-containing protein [Paraburkholderia]|uniref:DUF262 domain-containing protein n=1 Tax=Paraburkholderia TaxID=1822464 RepID=UPI00224ECB2E|nr:MULTISPECIES: DUF262 domain-containing protein [Paraburkholderia]MCX4164560.1 DUF262 domain-containing protein [Paraburkholderia megapolitana]MDN7160053.1 DUF262 domain-containing protein [Paraburkholderia sp. CHISQ3]MDQ6497100.1 DUF262 domain-containing protein [Paraburkholderia megapolitana]